MKQFFIHLVLFCVITKTNAQFGKPVFYYKISDPWAQVIGADIPFFVLYENGDILFTKKINDEIKIYHEIKDKDEKKKQLTKFLKNEKEYRYLLTSFTELTNFEDQPSNVFYFDTDSAYKIIIYGNMDDDSLVRAAMQKSKTVDIFEGVRKDIINYPGKAIAKEWLPDSIEVLLWDYNHCSSKGIAWPAEWQGLKYNTTIKRGDNLYSIYINKKDFDKLKKYIKKVNEDGGNTVLLNKKKWSISYRLPFPGIK